MASKAIHESRPLRQARPHGQYVDLPHRGLRKLLPQASIFLYLLFIRV
jgi:hypothetical protein